MSRIFNYDQKHFNHQNNVDNLIKIYELHYLTDEFYENYLSGNLNDYEAKMYRYSTLQYFNDDIF